MRLSRIMLAAPKSGSGKTTITCALLQAFKQRGEQVVAYKCGPDYIDPMFHKQMLGIPSKNLDTFFTGADLTRALFLKNRTEHDFAVIEGVMGLFDGLGGVREEGSSYHLAEVTQTPIVLVIDAKGMGRSLIPMLTGFLAYDKACLIRGVILNKMSKTYYEIIKPLIETELHIRVLGFLPEQDRFCIPSRHLGLVMPEEQTDIQKQLLDAAEALEETVDVDALVCIAQQAGVLFSACEGRSKDSDSGAKTAHRPVIAIARDEAFCFFYEDNLLLMQAHGAELVYFSPLHDTSLPDVCDALLLGGGYPELHAGELSRNERMRLAVREAFDRGMPIVAECGGFMYLHDAIIDKSGKRYAMAGVIPEICESKNRLVRFGYIELTEKQQRFLPEGERIKGHEFHYFDSTGNGESCTAKKPVTGSTYDCVMAGESFWFGFPHLYYPSNPHFAESFVKKAALYKSRKESSFYGTFTSFF